MAINDVYERIQPNEDSGTRQTAGEQFFDEVYDLATTTEFNSIVNQARASMAKALGSAGDQIYQEPLPTLELIDALGKSHSAPATVSPERLHVPHPLPTTADIDAMRSVSRTTAEEAYRRDQAMEGLGGEALALGAGLSVEDTVLGHLIEQHLFSHEDGSLSDEALFIIKRALRDVPEQNFERAASELSRRIWNQGGPDGLSIELQPSRKQIGGHQQIVVISPKMDEIGRIDCQQRTSR